MFVNKTNHIKTRWTLVGLVICFWPQGFNYNFFSKTVLIKTCLTTCDLYTKTSVSIFNGIVWVEYFSHIPLRNYVIAMFKIFINIFISLSCRPEICHRHACAKLFGLGWNFILDIHYFCCKFVFFCVQDLD